MNYKARKALSIISTIFTCAGVVLTGILVAKETPKANDKIKELKDKGVTKKIEYVKALLPIYWPAILTGAGTIASTTISQIISIKTEASLLATSTVLSQGWRKYKGKVKEVFGIEGEKVVGNEVSLADYEKNHPQTPDGKKMYYEDHIGFFSCDERDLLTALSDLNQRLHTPDPSPDGTFYCATLYFLMKDANAVVYDKTKLEACKNIGWTIDYLKEEYDLNCMWVHPQYDKAVNHETGEVLYTRLSFWEEPVTVEDFEISKPHEKTKEDYENEAAMDVAEANDLYDADAYLLSTHGYQDIPAKIIENELVENKPDCNRVEDNGRRFQPSNLNSTTTIMFIEEDSTLPGIDQIPNIKGK